MLICPDEPGDHISRVEVVAHMEHAVGHDTGDHHLLCQEHHIQDVLICEAQLVCVEGMQQFPEGGWGAVSNLSREEGRASHGYNELSAGGGTRINILQLSKRQPASGLILLVVAPVNLTTQQY